MGDFYGLLDFFALDGRQRFERVGHICPRLHLRGVNSVINKNYLSIEPQVKLAY